MDEAASAGLERTGRLRLLQFVHGYPPAVGGVEISVRDMCERLVGEHGFDVTVLTTNAVSVTGFRDPRQPTIKIDPDEEQNGVRILRFPVTTGWAPFLKQAQRIAYLLRLPGNDVLRTLYNGPICHEMLVAARSLQADVVCAASFPLNHMRYPFLLPEPRPPIVLIGAVHTGDEWAFNRPNLLRLVNQSYATVAHTQHEREWLIGHGASPDRVRVIGHGLDLGELRPSPGSFRREQRIDEEGYLVAYLGQQAPHKGIDTLIRVFPALLEQHPSAWLAIGGARTPFTAKLEQLITRLPASARARVRLVSDLSPQMKADLLGDCDVFASPSQAESFGITTLEAWSLGRPVVVGDSPSQRSIVKHGVSGLIVPYGNAEELLAALGRLTDKETRAVLGRQGRERLERHYRRSVVEMQYALLLREAAQTDRREPSANGL